MSTTRVDADALEELREQVLRKYGKLHGVLLREVNAAIRERIEHLADDNHGGSPDDE